MTDTTSRTGAVVAAIMRQLEARRGLVDGANDLGEVVVTVKLEAGTTVVKATAVEMLHVTRGAR